MFQNILKFDLTVTISVIIACVGVVTPFVSAVVNNLFLLHMKKLEYRNKRYEDTVLHKREILENYARYLSSCIANPTPENISKYCEYHSVAYMYMPKESRPDMATVYHLILDNRYDDASNYVEKLSTDACTSITSLSLKRPRT